MNESATNRHISSFKKYIASGRSVFAIILFLLLFIISGFGQTNPHPPAPTKQQSDSSYYDRFRRAFTACNFEEAMDLNEEFYAEARAKNDQHEIFRSLNGMFDLNLRMGNYEKSFSYAQELYDIAYESGNKSWIGIVLLDMGRLYAAIDDYAEAANYYRRLWEMTTATGTDPAMKDLSPAFVIEYGEVFSRLHQFDSAWRYLQLYKTAGSNPDPAYQLGAGSFYFLQGNYPQSLQNFQTAFYLTRNSGDLYNIIRSVLGVAGSELALGNSTSAIAHASAGLRLALEKKLNLFVRDGYKILYACYDRLGRGDSANYYFRKYTTVKDVVFNDQDRGKIAAYSYERRIDTMKKEKQIQEVQLKNETLIRNVLAAGIIFLLALSVLAYRNILLKRRVEANRRISVENELRIQKLESENTLAEMVRQQSDLEMMALRAQMNPHFIFNCLNSINQFIVRNNAEKAADYLTKFAGLVRTVLENSGKSFVPLDDELNSLKLYMDLEAIRFEIPFVYEFNLRQINPELVSIPSLLIQPFVENAIWHGLHPNKGIQGKIKIELDLEDDILHCAITDNGVGRNTGTASGTPEQVGRKSMGLALTERRLQLIDRSKESKAGISFRDLKDEAGRNAGTVVYIHIPVRTI